MISLIEHTSEPDPVDGHYNWEILFVKWVSVHGNPRSARQVRLDAQNRVIFNVPFAVPISSFRSERTRVIIANVPVVMLKMTAAFREPMPTFALVLHQHEMAKKATWPRHGSEACVLCRLARDLGVQAGSAHYDRRDMFVCYSCLCSWHDICAQLAANYFGDFVDDVEPAGFKCPVCRRAA